MLPAVRAVCEVLGSCGIVLLRGLPVDALTPSQIQLAYWALGCCWGAA